METKDTAKEVIYSNGEEIQGDTVNLGEKVSVHL